jgi:uncharacterized protein
LSDQTSQFTPDDELLKRIDAWRSQQEAPFSRSQAMAELIRAGLRGQANPALSLGEKLILSILCDVSRKVETEGTIDPDFLEAAIKGGHSWAIEWEHPSLAHGHTNSQATADFVIHVLSMWRLIEDSFGQLPDEAQQQVRKGAGLTGAPKFPGWHSEQEANYKSTARFMTDRMNLFPMFEGCSALDSGQPVVARYKQMLGILGDFDKAGTEQPLGTEQLVRLLSVA